jgi:hypothetical protein
MIVENISNKQLIILNLLGEGRNLVLPPKEKSDNILPTKSILNTLINKSDQLRLIVHDHMELEMLGELDPRASQIVVLE